MTPVYIKTEAADAGLRLDVYLSGYLEGYSRSYLQKLLKAGLVTVGGKVAKSSLLLTGEEDILLSLPEPEPLCVEAEDIPLSIVYEDDDLLVVNKPKGMVVHPAAGHKTGTLVNALLYHCKGRLSGINGVLRPGIVHRIDRDTTGLLLVCKNDKAHVSIAAQLAAHTITRRYMALVQGTPAKESGVIDCPIGRDKNNRLRMAVRTDGEGKHAVTHYQTLAALAGQSFMEFRLETGRTHQIRVHMAHAGHPLIGDVLYGGPALSIKEADGTPVTGQCLHAGILGFIHPSTQDYMEFEAPLPDYFQRLLRRRGYELP